MNPLPKPHLQQVIINALSLNPHLRAFSLVREAADDRPPGVCVILLGLPMIRHFGPMLEAHVRQHCQPPPNPKATAIMGLECTVGDMFNEMERIGWEFSYLQNPVLGMPALITLIMGNSVTKHFCAQLTARGCITRLK